MMTDDDVVTFGAMMFLAGHNHAEGHPVGDLETVGREQYLAAKEMVRREIMTFKRMVRQVDREREKGALKQ